MTMHKMFGTFAFDCEGCTEELDTCESEFEDANRAREAAGWRAVKGSDGEWEHYCPSCKENLQ